ncbi:hypothetical protein PCIT_a0006 [Pseudoalteromonas citrea]|uniref:Uncharacterized protein n=1 Tax=Pseudoalteromonas citrea TaxID=43655 RepID=A0AAD4AJY8_9GAMM|nr:hypothetical protein PCIT_a0006 [Pseudoalteromonas citrea]
MLNQTAAKTNLKDQHPLNKGMVFRVLINLIGVKINPKDLCDRIFSF